MTSDDYGMEAGGASDIELEERIDELTGTHHLTDQQVLELTAYLAERKGRNYARFETALDEMGVY